MREDLNRLNRETALTSGQNPFIKKHLNPGQIFCQFCSILLFYTICDFCSQSRLNAAKDEMDKTIVNIERISDCFPKLNIAKSGFYNFESDALDHSATLPTAYLQVLNNALKFTNLFSDAAF